MVGGIGGKDAHVDRWRYEIQGPPPCSLSHTHAQRHAHTADISAGVTVGQSAFHSVFLRRDFKCSRAVLVWLSEFPLTAVRSARTPTPTVTHIIDSIQLHTGHGFSSSTHYQLHGGIICFTCFQLWIRVRNLSFEVIHVDVQISVLSNQMIASSHLQHKGAARHNWEADRATVWQFSWKNDSTANYYSLANYLTY